MSKVKVSLPKGMRDFGPEQVQKRQYIINTIKSVFELYGFMPIETPVMENLTTLNGKGGEESDKLLFKVLNSGDYLKKAEQQHLEEKNYKSLLPNISEKGLRYDLTVPLARYVVMHQNELTFPFKRYQIQPVWRADRPQKGRYREFWQCDADVLGSDSLLNEVELIQIFAKVFKQLGIEMNIHLNTRKLLVAMVELSGKQDKLTSFTVILDKLDKIGIDKVIELLNEAGFNAKTFDLVKAIANNSSDFLNSEVAKQLAQTETGKVGLQELNKILSLIDDETKQQVKIDATLARGLDYYTGPIFEIKAAGFSGSLGSGGRYDNLTGNFGLPGVSGVGISFGLDRIYDVMKDQNLFPTSNTNITQVLLINFDKETEQQVFQLTTQLRQTGLKTEFYPTQAKLKKQMKYANDKNIPFVILAGSRELESGKLTLKNMQNGEQQEADIKTIISILKDSIGNE